MTTPEQFAQDSADLVAILSIVWIVILVLAWFLERRARRRRQPEILPPPCDGRDHNVESLAEWRRKYQRLDVDQIDRNRGTSS